MATANPVLVEVTRGSEVESRHRGAAVVVAADGRIVASWGDVETPVFPRSSVKPLQALPLIESGAADHFELGDEEVALACASHAGTAAHVGRIEAWLARLGQDARALECGIHAPTDPDAAAALTRAGIAPSQLHNNCSGKHAGFLTTAVHLGKVTHGYTRADHPIQEAVARVIGEMACIGMAGLPHATDGCGIPTIAMPPAALAHAFARLVARDDLEPARAAAAGRIVHAMTRFPDLVAGLGRFETRVMAAADGAVVAKGGAEGVQAAALPRLGLGLAVKIDDGAKRASETAMAALLSLFGGIAVDSSSSVFSIGGIPIGVVRPARGWPG